MAAWIMIRIPCAAITMRAASITAMDTATAAGDIINNKKKQQKTRKNQARMNTVYKTVFMRA